MGIQLSLQLSEMSIEFVKLSRENKSLYIIPSVNLGFFSFLDSEAAQQLHSPLTLSSA